MDRRKFLQRLAPVAAGAVVAPTLAETLLLGCRKFFFLKGNPLSLPTAILTQWNAPDIVDNYVYILGPLPPTSESRYHMELAPQFRDRKILDLSGNEVKHLVSKLREDTLHEERKTRWLHSA